MYCTRNDIEVARIAVDRLIQLCDDEGLGADNDLIIERIDAAIASAAARIDSLLAGAYSTPLNAHPLITSLAVDIAAFQLWGRRDGEPSKSVVMYYADAIKTLEMLRKEKLKNNDMLFPPTSSGDTIVLVDAPEAQFSPSKLSGML